MGDTVLYHREGAIGYITLNRPHVLNAMNDAWIHDMLAAMRAARNDREARVVVLRGNGRAFCAGADLKEESTERRDLSQYRWDHVAPMQEIPREARRMGKPIIAQVHGYAVGGGCEIAMLCDMRIAAEGTQFGFTETRVGATITMGGTYYLPRLVGLGKAKELLFSTDFIDAREAERIGLVNRVVPSEQLEQVVREMAERIAGHFPLETALTRDSVDKNLDTDLDTALEEEAQASIISLAAGSRVIGMAEAHKRIGKRRQEG